MRSFIVLTSVLLLIHFLSSKSFRDHTVHKLKKIIKNPLFLSVFSFVVLFAISTIFAVDKYDAFWGNLEKAEGLVGMIYFFSFFTYSLLVFEKEDWLWFFKLSLFASFALLAREFFEFFAYAKVDSFVGNATFLAGYLLFSILSSFIVFSETDSRFYKYFSVIIFVLSIFGIFIAQNRGTIVGLVAGLLFLLVYGIFKGKNISYKKLNFRTTSIILLSILVLFSFIFIPTRKSEIWQHVPGLRRIAAIGSGDTTTQTRILMGEISLKAVNPTENGLKKLLIGWGPENFSNAYGEYFVPRQFDFEKRWFNRAHNELFDTLVMNGLLGLMAYLSIYFFFFRSIFKRKEISLMNIGLAFFGVSFLTYLLFIFDQMTTYIPFFAVLSLALYLSINNGNNDSQTNDKNIVNNTDLAVTSKRNLVLSAIFILSLTLFMCFVYVKNDLTGFIQMKEYDSLRRKNDLIDISNNIDKVFEPFTVAQMAIRKDFLLFISANYDPDNKDIVRLYNLAFSKADEYHQKVPLDIQFWSILAYTYHNQGINSNNLDHLEFLKRAEQYFKEILLLAPQRPDFNYVLALNWFYQGRYVESFDYFEKIFNNVPSYFAKNNSGGAEEVYLAFIKHFYKTRDKENFIRAAERLKENNYAGATTLDQIIAYLNKTNIWPVITFD